MQIEDTSSSILRRVSSKQSRWPKYHQPISTHSHSRVYIQWQLTLTIYSGIMSTTNRTNGTRTSAMHSDHNTSRTFSVANSGTFRRTRRPICVLTLASHGYWMSDTKEKERPLTELTVDKQTCAIWTVYVLKRLITPSFEVIAWKPRRPFLPHRFYPSSVLPLADLETYSHMYFGTLFLCMPVNWAWNSIHSIEEGLFSSKGWQENGVIRIWGGGGVLYLKPLKHGNCMYNAESPKNGIFREQVMRLPAS